MDDGAKKAGGVFAGVLVAIGAFLAHGADDCARAGGRAAMSVGDDVARTGVRSADDLAGGFGGVGRYGDDLAYGGAGTADDLGRYGDDVAYGGAASADDLPRHGGASDDLVPSYGPGRTGGSFGGAHFGDELAAASHADDLGEVGTSLSDDLIEDAADLAIDVGADAVEFALSGDGDEPRSLPVLRAEARGVELRSVRVLALHRSSIADADRTVGSLAELDRALVTGGEATLDLVVLPPEQDALRAARSDDAILVRSAQLGRRAMLVVCADDREPLDACMASAARVALAAASRGPSGIAERLAEARDTSPSRRAIVLRRLHASEGSLRVATSR